MKNKKKLIHTIILSIVGIVVLITGIILINNHFSSESDGSIRITLVDLQKNTISDKNIEFYEGDTITEILEANLALSDVTTVSAGGSQCFPPV